MFTDIQGYTALMQQNEEKAIQAREKHRHIFNSITKKHRGRILQYYGDGTLSIFDSAIDAVECGTEMQLSFLQEPPIPVRIGIHIGDIIYSEDEIIGDGVNVASRIESLAVPGSVFISDKVYDEIKNQDSLKTSLLKTFKLKNIERPTEVYAISNEGLIVPDPADIQGKIETYPGESDGKPDQASSFSEPILATKLYIPPPLPKAVVRSRLMERLNLGLNGKLSLISAPPGFGKTTLVSEWAANGERPIAWFSMDKGDNDPARFLAYLVAALQSISANLGEGILGLLQSPQQPHIESILSSLLNEIANLNIDLTLVLDDYHVINNEPVNHAIAFMIEHLPPQMHLVITTREDPNLPLPRLRVRGQLTELRISDLRFTSSEAAEFLKHVMGLELAVENITALEARTEGWVAGLQLAALSMQGRDDIPGFIKAFSGDNRYVVDYLVEEVLKNQAEHIQRFLLQTSILDRLSGPLCDAVADQKGSKVLLETLERSNLFVVPLDSKRQWYRYQHLFADVLRSLAQEQYSDQIPVLHQRASSWYEQKGFAADAIHHALLSGDFERTATLTELAWPAMNKSCQDATWIGWVKEIPEELINVRPVLSIGYAWSLLICGELELAEPWLDVASALGEGDSPADQYIVVDKEVFKSLPASIANARAYLARASGDIPGTLKYTRQALDLMPESDYLGRAVPAALLGFVHMERGDLEEAYQSFTEMADSFKKNADISYLTFTFLLADIRIAQGWLREALSAYEKSLQLAKDHGESYIMGIEDLYRGLSEIHYQQGDLKTANVCLLKSEELNKKNISTDWQYRLYLAFARQKEVQGEPDSCLDLLNRAERLYVRNPLPDLQPVAALKARVWIGQGKLTEALHWVQEKGLSFDDELSYLHEFEYITLARVLIARYEREKANRSIEEALLLLKRLLEAAEHGKRNGSVIGILVLLAIAHEAQGDLSSALEFLERALTLAEPEGYIRIFVDEGSPMQRLLTQAAARGLKRDYIDKLITAFEPIP